MTPATPPAIPSDIPAEVWAEAERWFILAIDNPNALARPAPHHIALAIMAAETRGEERGKLMERERAIAACERQKASFASDEYATPQPLGGLMERFACDRCIDAIREGL